MNHLNEILEGQIWLSFDSSEFVQIISPPFRDIIKVEGCLSNKKKIYSLEEFFFNYYQDQNA